ncbi:MULTISPECIES: SMI1/KNR4 family protein [unclassified Paenibacillus]|uniref:SMI1/KNR4 family protein n=1 Tax=Paenibacillus TaxID=44249 RepID=UPI000CFB38C0|nr:MULTISPECIES: SMI1/KNR4 family protein [unclassified Paenibacillus]MDR6716411.1 cell wall assembly regulator SMI1 [Paenibacillus sp. 2003]PRA09501.1 SMI1 / KNR4 family protein [Paenibacillus sp. MYb63]PRA46255.1 SMI1 / KNR4 family protein [Paenibacillus sp. MYb67]QZN73729.1 SMI1/KNR4 family protein [Paenibacillus sp. DR312]
MDLVNKFLNGLRAALSPEELEELKTASGATKEDITTLRSKYPNCPESLIVLLENIDGTYWRKYGEKEITVCILGSDVEEGRYPYYLLSTQQMLESSKNEEDVSYLLEYEDEEDAVDSKINPEGLLPGKYIHFSDCMNNGGTSRLYIDFNPTDGGVRGQIIRFLHDPDEYVVIANSFDEYLQGLVDSGFVFLNEEE